MEVGVSGVYIGDTEEESFVLLFRSILDWYFQLSEYNLQLEAPPQAHQVQAPNCALLLPMQNHRDRFLFGNLLRSWSDSSKLLSAVKCINVFFLLVVIFPSMKQDSLGLVVTSRVTLQ